VPRTYSLNLFMPAAPRRKLKGWRIPADAILHRIGPTWRSSPIRRLIQTGFFILFLLMFFAWGWPYSSSSASGLADFRERLPLEFFLWIDPLVGLSTAIAARHWNVALIGMAAILLVCLVIPRGFCGYVCPLGTLIDAFDWLIGRHIKALRIQRVGVWANLRYWILLAVLVSAALGVMTAGYVAAIPVLTRGLLLSGGQIQIGFLKSWNQISPWTAGSILSLCLFAIVLLLGLLSPRFWCRYVCPSGAVFSVFNLFRVNQRKVESSCIKCNKCIEVCPFDAIESDFNTRALACTLCQTCGGVCPTHSIKFVSRWNEQDLKEVEAPNTEKAALSRRAILAAAIGGAAAAVAIRPPLARAQSLPLLRPPGSVSEEDFLNLCIRCGECFKVCPGPVLHPANLSHGLNTLWTPIAVPTHAGCHQDCNFCTLVCPTGAIVPLSIEQKRKTIMGLAVIHTDLCLPHRGRQDCQLCYDECEAAGYHAIEMRPIQLDIGPVPEGVFSQEQIEEMSRITAPFIRADACVGCGLCEYRCNAALVKQQGLLERVAVEVKGVDRSRR
jgi:polyferredoxin